MAYNLVMELEVSCNNVGKCPWIGHLSELVAHQNICDKTMKILEENNKKIIKRISKRFSYDKECIKIIEKDNTVFRTETKKNKISKEGEIMINNLKNEKEKFLQNTNARKTDLINEEEKNEFKKAFS